jgi:hypothetical protein
MPGANRAAALDGEINWTDGNGTTITQTATNWRDVDTLFSVQKNETLVYSGTLPVNGYAVSVHTQLQSEN